MSNDEKPVPAHDAPILPQEQVRALGALMLQCLQEHGGDGLMIDEDDAPSAFRMTRIGTSLVVADFCPDPGKGRLRHVDLQVTKRGACPFPIDRRSQLVSFQATHFALPPDWHVEVDRPPEEWLEHALLQMQAAVRDVLDRASVC